MTEEFAVIAVLVIIAGLAGFAAFRLWRIRSAGTPAILRKVPGERWRHGVIRYGEGSLVFFQLTSMRTGPDVRMDRQTIEVLGRRRPVDAEHDLMSSATVVTEIRGELVSDSRDQVLEIAMDAGAFTAFMSWVESRPSDRSRRRRPN